MKNNVNATQVATAANVAQGTAVAAGTQAVTLKIEVTTTDGVTDFVTLTNKKRIAIISSDSYHAGKYIGKFGVFESCNNSTFAEAVEFVSDCIERHFAEYGINVEFLTNEGQIITERYLATRRIKGDFRTVLVDRRTGKPVKMKNGGEWYGITVEEADRIAQGLTLGTTVKNAGVDIYDMSTGEIVSRIN